MADAVSPKEAELRRKFQEQTEEMGVILDKLRPGTGPAVALFLMQAWDDGFEAGERKERERCAKLIEEAVIPESFRKTSIYTEFERGGDNYLKMVAGAIRGGESTP